MSGRQVTLALLIAASAARAQDSEVPPPPDQPQPEQAQEQIAPPPSHVTRTPPAPILVHVITTGRLPEELVTAARTAFVEQLTAMSSGRPVLAVQAPEMQQAIAACRDEACLGGVIAQASAQAGALLRLTSRGAHVNARIELLDPVSGAARMPPVEGQLPRDAAALPAALGALTAQLHDAIPPLPPQATLLVTVSRDGAAVGIDGDHIGDSPVAAEQVDPGSHQVTVVLAGFAPVRRRVEVRVGEQARIDVTLERATGTGGLGAVGSGNGGWAAPVEQPAHTPELYEEWWFWTILGGSAVVLAAVLIGIGVAASGGPPPDPQGIMLPPISGGP